MSLICLQCGAKQTTKGAVFCSVCGSMNLADDSSDGNITFSDPEQKTVPLDEYYKNRNSQQKQQQSQQSVYNPTSQKSVASQTVPVSRRYSSERGQNDLGNVKPVLPNINITPPARINENSNIKKEKSRVFSSGRNTDISEIQNSAHISDEQNAVQIKKPAPYTPPVKNVGPANFGQKKEIGSLAEQKHEQNAVNDFGRGNAPVPENRQPFAPPINQPANQSAESPVNQQPNRPVNQPVNQPVNPYADTPKQINIEPPRIQYGSAPDNVNNRQVNFNGSNPYVSDKKKKSPVGIIIGCVAAFVVLALLIIIPVALKTPDIGPVNSANKTPNKYDFELPPSYTKGTITNGVYENEWADIKFTITSDWPEAEASQYENYETLNTECGFLSADPLFGKQLAFQFEDLSYYGKSYTANDYLDALKMQYENTFEQNGIDAYFEDYFDYTIAGKDYLTLLVQSENGVILCSCVRILDDYAVVISASSSSEDEIVSVFSQIQPYS